MKYVLYILAILLCLVGLGEIFTAGIIAEGLLKGQAPEDRGCFVLKLLIHIVYSFIAMVAAWFLLSKGRKRGGGEASGT